MKKYLILLYGLITILNNCFSQTTTPYITCFSGSATPCNSYPIYVQEGTPTEFNFSHWDWTDQTPCNWISFPGVSQNYGISVMCVKPPFAASTNIVGSMVPIAATYDYLNANPNHSNYGVPSTVEKDQGWELVNASFNSLHPHFILYNKYTAKLRAFFYIPEGIGESYSTYAIVCTYEQNNQSPAILATANDPIKPLDQYHQGSSNDLIVKSIDLSTKNSWVVADFPIMYDNNISGLLNSANRMRVQLFGIQNFGITLSGTAVSPFAYTNSNEIEMVGNSSGFSSHSFNAEDASAKLKELFESTADLVKVLEDQESSIPANADPALLKLKNNLMQALGSVSGNNTQESINFGKLLETASKISGVVGAAVGVFEMFYGHVEDQNSTPDVASAYKINLTGSMTLTSALGGGSYKIPGTTGSFGQESTPNLYDCPMGRINLVQTPHVNRSNFYARIPYIPPPENPIAPGWEFRYYERGYMNFYVKCKFNEDVILTENIVKDKLGNNLVRTDVKYAFKMKASENPTKDDGSINEGWYDILNPNILTWRYRKQNTLFHNGFFDLPSYTYQSFSVRNQIKDYLDKGIFIIHKFEENGSHVYGTPYMSPEDFKGVCFEIPRLTEVKLAVMATYKNMATGEVYVFSNAYDVDLDLAFNNYGINNEYLNDQEYPTYPLSDFYNIPFNYSFNSPFFPNSMSLLNNVYSASEVAMLPGFNSSIGYGAVGVHPYKNNGGALVMTTNYVSGTCGNSQGQRVGAEPSDNYFNTKTNSYSIYPNPSNGNVRIDLKNSQNADVHVFNDQGVVVYTQKMVNSDATDLNLSDQPEGIYMIKINTGFESISEKIVIQK